MIRIEGRSAMAGASTREILAAWVFCGLIAVGGLLLAAPNRDAAGTSGIYAGAQIPGIHLSTSSDRSIEDEFADLYDVPGDGVVTTMLASKPADKPAVLQQCWLRSVVHRL
jgi:hypothetical protein